MRFFPPNQTNTFVTMLVYAGSQTARDALLIVCKHFPDEHNFDNGFRLCTTLPSHKDNKP